MMRWIAVLIMLVLVSSCNNKSSTPSDLIGKDKMADVLGDMMMADEFSIGYFAPDSSKAGRENNAGLYEKVFAIHAISKDQFIRSYKFYEADPIQLKVIFDSVNERFSRLRNGYYPREQKKSKEKIAD